jgi:NCS1 family nucleobase:cation symporter-1
MSTVEKDIHSHDAIDVVDHIVEGHSIDYVPPSERYGKPVSLLTYWFSVNACALTVSTGAIGIALGASLRNTILAIVLGNLFGTIFMAYHSAQGPKLGLPQMIQSRAQFGFYGAILPNLLVIVTLVGYVIVFGVIGGEAVAGLVHTSTAGGIAIFNLVLWAVVAFGYKAIHRLNAVMAVVSVAVMTILVVQISDRLGSSHYHPTFNTFGTFLLIVSICVSWQVTYAPLVSEFSRYLPEKTPTYKTVVYTYVGSAVGAIMFMTIGAMAGAEDLNGVSGDTANYLAGLIPLPRSIAFLVLALAIVAATCENLYGSYTTFMATVSISGTRFSPRITRAVVTGVIAVGSGFVEVAVSSNFITNLTNFLSFVLYLLIPWTAINLVDYYVIRKGKYSIADILNRDGRYGLVSWTALAIYVVAVAVQIPFMDSTIYEGPIAAHWLGGGDIAWIAGLAVGGFLYWLVARTRVPAVVPVAKAESVQPSVAVIEPKLVDAE